MRHMTEVKSYQKIHKGEIGKIIIKDSQSALLGNPGQQEKRGKLIKS